MTRLWDGCAVLTLTLTFGLVGCGHSISSADLAGLSPGVGAPSSPAGGGLASIPTNPPSVGGGVSSRVGALPGCHSNDSTQLCLALNYVVFSSPNGDPVVTAPIVYSGVSAINQIWEQCKIQFQVDQLLFVEPQKFHLPFHSSENSDLDEIRKQFMNHSTLLVVTTGKWDRNGSLGSTGANAWTTTPGENFYGAILEAPVGDYPNLIAHELGHYLNLDHVDDADELMNPMIYRRSTQLTQSECEVAQSAIQSYWRAMLR